MELTKAVKKKQVVAQEALRFQKVLRERKIELNRFDYSYHPDQWVLYCVEPMSVNDGKVSAEFEIIPDLRPEFRTAGINNNTDNFVDATSDENAVLMNRLGKKYVDVQDDDDEYLFIFDGKLYTSKFNQIRNSGEVVFNRRMYAQWCLQMVEKGRIQMTPLSAEMIKTMIQDRTILLNVENVKHRVNELELELNYLKGRLVELVKADEIIVSSQPVKIRTRKE